MRYALINIHDESACEGGACCIHNPSAHSMIDLPQHWRNDRGLMERVCEHGVGHPDPDHLDYVRESRGGHAAWAESIHGCDGCCSPDAALLRQQRTAMHGC